MPTSALGGRHLLGHAHCAEADEGKGGSIVNISSICGTLGTPYMSGYSAAKAAVINFSRGGAEGAHWHA
jgi:short-subunit dehydrogenase